MSRVQGAFFVKWGIVLLLFLGLLAGAWFGVIHQREHAFELLHDGRVVHMAADLGHIKIGQSQEATFVLRHRDGYPFTIRSFRMNWQRDFTLSHHQTVTQNITSFTFTVRFSPRDEGPAKSDFHVLIQDHPEFLFDFSGIGQLPDDRITSFYINGRHCPVAYNTRTILFPIPTRQTDELDALSNKTDPSASASASFSLSQDDLTLQIGGHTIQSGDTLPFLTDASVTASAHFVSSSLTSSSSTLARPFIRSYPGATTTISLMRHDIIVDTYRIVATTLPVMSFEGELISKKIPRIVFVEMLAPDPQDDIPRQIAGVRIRGDISQSYYKKPYAISFYKNKRKKTIQKKDIRVLDLRKDADWALDAMYMDHSLMRNKLVMDLYRFVRSQPNTHNRLPTPSFDTSFDETAHAASTQISPKSRYVELVVNNRYDGVYDLSEKVDYKLLKIEKNKGAVFKAAAFPDSTDTWYRNLIQKHPKNAPFDPPTKRLVDTYFDHLPPGSDTPAFDFEAVVDFHLTMILAATVDNISKNWFLAKQTTSSPYFFIPWDVGASFGMDTYANPIPPEIQITPYIQRIMSLHPEYVLMLKARWKSLHDSTLQPEVLLNLVDTYYTTLTESDAIDRSYDVFRAENLSSIHRTYFDQQIAYLKAAIHRQFSIVDDYIQNL